MSVPMAGTETAILAGGCFWCTEAIFRRLNGVLRVVPGYAGGTIPDPTYTQVSSGQTGHAEAIRIEFDPGVLSFADLLDVFFHTHDPTTVNRQGNDEGPQYRSAVFFRDKTQRETAERLKEEYNRTNAFGRPVVTEIVPYTNFYGAENYHRDYFENHRDAPYCSVIIAPKINHLLSAYGKRVREEYVKDAGESV
jgi:peptide-methionine (S)-S-oxide reductase